MTPILFLLVLAAPDAGVDPLRVEADARQEALVKAGFNLTHGFGLTGGSTMRREFLVPPRAQSHRFSLWARAARGLIAVRWLGPNGVLASFESPSGEVTLDGPLPPGRHVLELDATRAGASVAALGIKGSVTSGCTVDDAVSETPADPARGWHWPFLRYVPKQVKSARVLVVPNNSGFVSDDLELLRASGRCELQRARVLADQLGVSLLVPPFPSSRARRRK